MTALQTLKRSYSWTNRVLERGRAGSFDNAQDELARLLLCSQQRERPLSLKLPKIQIFIDTFLTRSANYRVKAKAFGGFGKSIKLSDMNKRAHMEIAEGLQQGNRDAWLSLYELYAEKLWCNVARLMAHDPSSVADVVQETLLSAARSAKNFNPRRGPLWTWLWAIAKRQVALHYRKRTSKAIIARARQWWNLLDGRTSDWIEGGEKPPAEVLESDELATLVRYTLAELSAEYQRLLMAKYVDGLTIEDIAEETNGSSVAIRSKLARARKAFRQTFKKLTHSTPGILEMAP